MADGFHPGEVAVQERAGVRHRAGRIAGAVHRDIPDAARTFLEERPFVVLATADPAGRPWASVLGGPAGFASVPDPRTVRLEAVPTAGDPLAENLAASDLAGLLAIDLATRRRMRVNGRLVGRESGILIRTDQVYANCPKYIQPREAVPSAGLERGVPARAGGLSDAQRAWIGLADTFFIATLNPGEGADASHRGGPAGFVEVDGNRLAWPDYAGNMMYNTLGNIAVHPRAGLLFPDFVRGTLLLLTGRARIDWHPGVQRRVELEVEEAVEL
ncbi:MAG TPA: pyridoxamine 5'-phosphate oxidase family protein [Gemmatimonadales bacterium]|nr:pyridoxamine 5'-phosphate oxidase family protein [Gemmatimonadales bacterium]